LECGAVASQRECLVRSSVVMAHSSWLSLCFECKRILRNHVSSIYSKHKASSRLGLDGKCRHPAIMSTESFGVRICASYIPHCAIFNLFIFYAGITGNADIHLARACLWVARQEPKCRTACICVQKSSLASLLAIQCINSARLTFFVFFFSAGSNVNTSNIVK